MKATLFRKYVHRNWTQI